jgi:lipopolysaccharide export system protein LptC
MNRLYSLTLVFFIIAGGVYGIIEWRNASLPQFQTIDETITPDFIAENLHSNVYKAKGSLAYVVDAQRMEHYAALAITNFEFPQYTLHPKNNAPAWKVTANEGILYNNNRVKLEHQVRLKATDPTSLLQEVQGKYFELDLRTNIISSEQEIRIIGKGFTIDGKGLIVDLNTNQMTLTKHVKSIYEIVKE